MGGISASLGPMAAAGAQPLLSAGGTAGMEGLQSLLAGIPGLTQGTGMLPQFMSGLGLAEAPFNLASLPTGVAGPPAPTPLKPGLPSSMGAGIKGAMGDLLKTGVSQGLTNLISPPQSAGRFLPTPVAAPPLPEPFAMDFDMPQEDPLLQLLAALQPTG